MNAWTSQKDRFLLELLKSVDLHWSAYLLDDCWNLAFCVSLYVRLELVLRVADNGFVRNLSPTVKTV